MASSIQGYTVLAAADLAAGRLVAPFAATIDHDFAYYVVYPKTATTPPNVAAFRDWLAAEAAGDPAGHVVS